jgi:hypothetical protein
LGPLFQSAAEPHKTHREMQLSDIQVPEANTLIMLGVGMIFLSSLMRKKFSDKN